MTEEQKQALIEWLKPQIDELQNVSDETPFGLDSDSEMHLNTMRVALSALTAQPVKLPDYTPEVYPNNALENQKIKSRNDAISDCADAIRAVGYQVEGE